MFSAPYISSIPVSLLLAIFETVGDEPVVWNKRDPVYTNHHGTDLFSFTLDRSVRPPPQRLSLTISHVCSQWRYLVTGEARLWAAIVVNSYNRGDAFLVGLSLSRSKNHLLRLALLKPRWSTVSERHLRGLSSTPVMLKAFLYVFLRHISRWEYINLDIWWDNCGRGCTDLFNMVSVDSAKFLEVAILQECGGKELTPSFYRMWEIFHRSPQLRCVAWNANEKKLRLTPPYSQLRGLDVHVHSLDECLMLLRSCVQLKSFHVTAYHSQILEPLYPVVANNLLTLTFYDSFRHCHYSHLLDKLTLPALRHLDIKCLGRSRDEQPHRSCLESIPDMLSRSSAHLDSFFFYDWGVDEPSHIQLLSSPCMFDLRHLRLGSHSNWSFKASDAFFDGLDVRRGVLPCLRTFLLLIPVKLRESRSLTDFVSSRVGPGSDGGLQVLHLGWNRRASATAMEYFNTLCREGKMRTCNCDPDSFDSYRPVLYASYICS